MFLIYHNQLLQGCVRSCQGSNYTNKLKVWDASKSDPSSNYVYLLTYNLPLLGCIRDHPGSSQAFQGCVRSFQGTSYTETIAINPFRDISEVSKALAIHRLSQSTSPGMCQNLSRQQLFKHTQSQPYQGCIESDLSSNYVNHLQSTSTECNGNYSGSNYSYKLTIKPSMDISEVIKAIALHRLSVSTL